MPTALDQDFEILMRPHEKPGESGRNILRDLRRKFAAFGETQKLVLKSINRVQRDVSEIRRDFSEMHDDVDTLEKSNLNTHNETLEILMRLEALEDGSADKPFTSEGPGAL